MSNTQALLTLPKFLVWVKEQEPTKTFKFVDIENCSIAQYLKANGQVDVNVGATVACFGREPRVRVDIPKAIRDVMTLVFDGDNELSRTHFATFGALAEQLEKVNA